MLRQFSSNRAKTPDDDSSSANNILCKEDISFSGADTGFPKQKF